MTKAEREKKKQLFLEAYEDSKGMVTTSCERAGISRETLRKWRASDEKFNERIEVIKDSVQDYVEGQLMSLIRQGQPSAIYFWLKCKGGWREVQKIEMETNNQIDVGKAIEEIKEKLS